MRNKWSALLIIVLFQSAASAQTTISIGVKGGAGFSKWVYEKPSEAKQYISVGAIPLEIMCGEHWGVQTELMYIQKKDVVKSRYSTGLTGFNDPEENVYLSEVRYNYAELPVMLKYVRGEKLKFLFVAGAVFAYALNGKYEYSSNLFNFTQMGKVNLLGLKRFMAGLTAGAGIKIPVGNIFITGDLRYSFGLTNLATSGKTHLRDMTATAGLLFPLKRKSSGL